MHRGDLRRIGHDIGAGADPDHHGRNQIARAGRVIVEQAEHITLPEADAELFMQLAQRGLRLRLALVAAPAGQRPLRGVRAQGGGTAGQQERRAPARLGFGQRDGHRRTLQRTLGAIGGRPRKCRA